MWSVPGIQPATKQRMTQKCYSNCLLWQRLCTGCVKVKKLLGTQIRTHDSTKNIWNVPVAWISINTEAGMLSGMSQKRSIRSNPYWFTEFCNSQCLSHFAAPFIVVRAETSVAESCAWCNEVVTHPRQHTDTFVFQQVNGSFTQKEDSPMVIHYPRTNARGSRCYPNPVHKFINGSSQWKCWICVNDPSAGSPTETLLRLLLPLSDKVH